MERWNAIYTAIAALSQLARSSSDDKMHRKCTICVWQRLSGKYSLEMVWRIRMVFIPKQVSACVYAADKTESAREIEKMEQISRIVRSEPARVFSVHN